LNYLGHLLALPGEGVTTLGNMLGDFVKGRLETIAPPSFRLGVRLHRELDGFTDSHPAVKRSKALVPPERRRVAGVLVDIFYDHFFVEGVDFDLHRDALRPYAGVLPEDIRGLPEQMLSTRWFGAYARVDGIGQILAKMDQRRFRAVGLLGGECILEDHYDAIRRDALEFFPEMRAFTKEAILRLRSAYPGEAQTDGAAGAAWGLPGMS
jgi:acyl carrier protein phosphodiesterase